MKRASTTDTPQSKAKKTMASSTPRAKTTGAPQSNAVSTPGAAPTAASADADSVNLLSVQVAAFRAKVICHLMTPKTMNSGANYCYRDLDSVGSYLKNQMEATSALLYDKFNAGFAQRLTIAYVSADMHHLKSWELTVRSMSAEDRKVWRELSDRANFDKTRPISPEYKRYYEGREQQNLAAKHFASEMRNLCADFITGDDGEAVSGATFDLIPGLLRTVWCFARTNKEGRGQISNKQLKHIILQVWVTGMEDHPATVEAARQWCLEMGVCYDEVMGTVTIKPEDGHAD